MKLLNKLLLKDALFLIFLSSVGGDICYNATALSATVCPKKELCFSAHCRSQSQVSVTSSWTVHSSRGLLIKLSYEECFKGEDLLQCFGLFQVQFARVYRVEKLTFRALALRQSL